jgi:hypothetical protein
MKNTEEAYIGLELGTHSYPDDCCENAMNDILDEGIEITATELYDFIYENGYSCTEEHLKMLLNDFDDSKNMYYPLTCFKSTSYEDWVEHKSFRDGKDKGNRLVVFGRSPYKKKGVA